MMRLLLFPLSAALAIACSQPPPKPPAVRKAAEWGAELFADPKFSPSGFNSFSCSTCHRTNAAPSGDRIDSGYSLHNVIGRPSWWGGYELDLLDAVNFCYVYFMRGDPLSREDPASMALYEFLASISPDHTAPALPLTVVKNVAELPRGDRARGEQVYRAACQTCHGDAATGVGRISDTVPVIQQVISEYPHHFPGIAPSVVVIEKVRHGQFFDVGGEMPFYSQEALSDEELAALLAWLGL